MLFVAFCIQFGYGENFGLRLRIFGVFRWVQANYRAIHADDCRQDNQNQNEKKANQQSSLVQDDLVIENENAVFQVDIRSWVVIWFVVGIFCRVVVLVSGWVVVAFSGDMVSCCPVVWFLSCCGRLVVWVISGTVGFIACVVMWMTYGCPVVGLRGFLVWP